VKKRYSLYEKVLFVFLYFRLVIAVDIFDKQGMKLEMFSDFLDDILVV